MYAKQEQTSKLLQVGGNEVCLLLGASVGLMRLLIPQRRKKMMNGLTLSHKLELCVQLKRVMPSGAGSVRVTGWF